MRTVFNSKSLLLRLPVFLLVATVLTFSSCKKSSTTTTNDSTSAEDKADVTTALNSAADDASNVAGNLSKTTGKTASLSVCNLTIDSVTGVADSSFTIVYNGTVCGSGATLTRSGTVTVSLLGYAGGTRWQTPGATLQLAFTNVVYKNVATGGSVTFNGTYNIENVTGGLAWKIMAGDSSGTCVHKETATGLTITFEDGTQRTWNINRSRTYSNIINAGQTTISVSGGATANGISNVDMWGTNRNNVEFTNSIASPITVSLTCGLFKPYTGQETQTISNRSVTVNYGVNSLGDPASSCGEFYKVTYTVNGVSKTITLPYWF